MRGAEQCSAPLGLPAQIDQLLSLNLARLRPFGKSLVSMDLAWVDLS